MSRAFAVAFLLCAFCALPAEAEVVSLDADRVSPRVAVYPLPQNASFLEGSIFEVPLIIDTRGSSVNTVELNISFDRTRLQIVNPSGGRSIIGIWVEPPVYDNTKGTARLAGVIPNGIKTDSGLIATLTFKAVAPGTASLSFTSDSSVLLNDGIGSGAIVEYARGRYDIVTKPPEGVAVYSSTHPSPSSWYNNRNPSLSWDAAPETTGYSYVIDTIPTTVPEARVMTTDTVAAFDTLADGVWFFHLRANKRGVWGGVSHFPIRIDTGKPAVFLPQVERLVSGSVERRMISFATTDSLSGVDRYEVGVVDASRTGTESPVFVEAESPYQLPPALSEVQVIVRAFDRAGNVYDATLLVSPQVLIISLIQKYLSLILALVLGISLAFAVFHYLYRHHVGERVRRAVEAFEKESPTPEPSLPPTVLVAPTVQSTQRQQLPPEQPMPPIMPG